MLSLNVRGLNSSRKRRQVFRWLHQQQSDIIFLQETYSSAETIKRWETEWGGKIISSHGSTHSRGVMILFKPRLDVGFEKITTDSYGRFIIAEAIIDGTKIVLVNIYAPNDSKQQIAFLRDLSKQFLSMYANENLVLGGDFNCVISTLDKKGGRPIDSKQTSINELQALIKTHNLLDSWRLKNPNLIGFTWANPSMKIQCRLDYFFVSKQLKSHLNECKILSNIHSDHSAVALSLRFDDSELTRGPGFWKFNNSLLSDTNYVELLTFMIPVFAKKHQHVKDQGLYWEMIKMEIRAFTIKFSKEKAKQKCNEEKALLSEMTKIQIKLQTSYSDSLKSDMEKIKSKLSRIASVKTRGAIVRSRTRWYEHGERNSKYFYNLEKTNQKKKHITSLVVNDGDKITSPKDILEEEERFFRQIYTSTNTDPSCSVFNEFFKTENALSEENATICEGAMSVDECERALKFMENNKTPGTDGLTSEFYRYFWHMVGSFMVNSFNHAFQNGTLSISQRQGIISLIPKKKKNIEYLNVDYKIATKTIALRLETILPNIVHPCQSGYVKGRFIGESIRLIADTMHFTKQKEIPGVAVFLDFEKAFDSIEWNFVHKCLETLNFGPDLRQWIKVFYNNISSCVMNNGHASRHFNLERGVRQGCPLSGTLFVIAMELLSQCIRRSKEIKGITIQENKEVKLSQYADDTTVLLSDVQSVFNLFDLLSLFEKCSGLKINQTKSEMLWLGSLRHRKDPILNLQISSEPVYALGVHFTYDREVSQRKNFFDKLGSLKKTLNIWSQRDISLYGKINLVKTLALSKLVFICSVMETPKDFNKEVNNITFDFIWNHKPAKIKKTTVISQKTAGGLNMRDFSIFDKALKLNWVKRLCSNSDAPWQYIPKFFLAGVGGTELFKCNYDYKLLDFENLPDFYKQVISYWQDIAATTPKSKNEVLSQNIWNNRFITVNRKMLFFPRWNQVGIRQISDLFDSHESRFLTFHSFRDNFDLKCNFLQYCSLLSSIPQSWKKLLHERSENIVKPPISICSLTCKTLYDMLLDLEDLPPPTSEKKILACGVEREDLNKIYLLPFQATKEIKLAMFQYKIIHQILPTNSLLYKMKKVASPFCPFCPSEYHTIWHLFTQCTQATSFWNEFQEWYSFLSNTNLILSELDVMFGITRCQNYCLALNHLIILGKYFIYVNALNTSKYRLNDFISLVREKINLEKYIAVTSNKEKEFENKWKHFLSV